MGPCRLRKDCDGSCGKALSRDVMVSNLDFKESTLAVCAQYSGSWNIPGRRLG